MTAQEKINQLAAAALRSAPPTGSVPKPATYMAPFDKPKAKEVTPVEEVAKAEEFPVPAEEVTVASKAEAPAKSFVDNPDVELRALIEDREERIEKKLGRQSLAVTLSVLALLAGAGVWISVSPKAKASLAAVIPALKESVADVKVIGSITTQYDESLDKIAVRGDQIDNATRSIGADPDMYDKADNQALDDEMAKMMGEDAVTTGDRDRALQEKFGFINNLMDGDKKKDQEATPSEP